MPEAARKRAAAVIDRIKGGLKPFPAPAEPELTVAVGLAGRYMERHVKVKASLDRERSSSEASTPPLRGWRRNSSRNCPDRRLPNPSHRAAAMSSKWTWGSKNAPWPQRVSVLTDGGNTGAAEDRLLYTLPHEWVAPRYSASRRT